MSVLRSGAALLGGVMMEVCIGAYGHTTHPKAEYTGPESVSASASFIAALEKAPLLGTKGLA